MFIDFFHIFVYVSFVCSESLNNFLMEFPDVTIPVEIVIIEDVKLIDGEVVEFVRTTTIPSNLTTVTESTTHQADTEATEVITGDRQADSITITTNAPAIDADGMAYSDSVLSMMINGKL